MPLGHAPRSYTVNWIQGTVGTFQVMSGTINKGDFVSQSGSGVMPYSSSAGIFGVALSGGSTGSTIRVVQAGT